VPIEPRQRLIQALRSESVAVIVGTGVSIGAVGGPTAKPTATWIGLLQDGLRAAAQHAGKSERWVARELEKLQEAFDEEDLSSLLAVASEVEARLEYPEHGAWAQWLRGSFEGWELADARVPEALIKLGAGTLFTTNYDDVLQIASGGELEPVAYTNERKVTRIVRGQANGIVHLHGHWDSPESVVLGRSSYADVVGSEHAQAMQQALASMRTLLFVGFGGGLEDPNFGPLLEWMKTFRRDEHEHFRLARADEVGAIRKAHPSAQRITVMSYGDTHADLPTYLEALARDASGELKATPPPTGRVVVESGDQRELSPASRGSSRTYFSVGVKRRLADRVGGRCSHPSCGRDTVGPTVDPGASVNVGAAAHITASSVGGPRYDSGLSTEERSSGANGIWLCETHAKLIDTDPDAYPIGLLQGWKQAAEELQRSRVSDGTVVGPQSDLRVSVAALRQVTGGSRSAIQIAVANHGDRPAFIAGFSFELLEGLNGWPRVDFITREYNTEFRLEPGDSRTFHCSPADIPDGIVTAFVTDKLDRKYRADPKDMRDALHNAGVLNVNGRAQ